MRTNLFNLDIPTKVEPFFRNPFNVVRLCVPDDLWLPYAIIAATRGSTRLDFVHDHALLT